MGIYWDHPRNKWEYVGNEDLKPFIPKGRRLRTVGISWE